MMNTADFHAFRLGRIFQGRFKQNDDLLDTLNKAFRRCGIQNGSFSVYGRVIHATIGIFDTAQQVYVTHKECSARQILSCNGHYKTRCKNGTLSARIILADENGVCTGGNVFINTLIEDGRFDLFERLKIQSLSSTDLIAKS